MDDTTSDPDAEPPPPQGGAQPADVDENGWPLRLPGDPGGRSPEELDAALAAMSQELGGATRDYARMAAIERLTEMRAAGTMSEEDYRRERRRLENYG